MKQEITRDPSWNIIYTKSTFSEYTDIPTLFDSYEGLTAHWINRHCSVCNKDLKECEYVYWYRTVMDRYNMEYKPYCSIKCIVVDAI